jgi:hypothetical protein
MRSEWPAAALWCCFLLRLAFYSAALPLWEGYDEWAHFAVVRAVAHGQALPSRDGPLPRDVEESLLLAPVAWDLKYFPAPSLTHDDFWRLPATERAARAAAFHALPREWRKQSGTGPLRAYEALQPPLYYWLMAPLLWIFPDAPLAAQVLLLRLAAAFIASLALPFVYFAARRFFGDPRLALACAAVVALMPELAFDVARVGNDCLAVLLFTILTALALGVTRESRGVALWLGIVLGFGLLTKAYFLTAIPAVALILAPFGAAALARGMLPPLLLAGWWYAHNLFTTGTLSGLSESVTLRGQGAFAVLSRAGEVPWRTAVDSILLSHLWFGGWSGLTVRSWMYHLLYALAGAALAGCCLRSVKRQGGDVLRLTDRSLWSRLCVGGRRGGEFHGDSLWRPLLIYGFFWLGQCYNVLLIFLSKGVPTSMGWYLYAVVGAEVILCTAGLAALVPKRARAWPALSGVILFAALDLYTLNAVAIPYYTGMIRHRANGSLEALHSAAFQGVFDRLAIFSAAAPSLLSVLWVLYLAATFAIAALALRRHNS